MLVIVLATYNGEKYLQEQVDSIRAQTVTEWTLLVSDDNSSDGTLKLLHRLAREDRRIRLMPHASRRLGPTMNFARLLSHAFEVGAQYVALADQDDVWFPTKLKSQLQRIQAIEAAAGLQQPALVHSDAEVVGTMLNPIAGSRHHFSGSSNQAHLHSNALGRLLLHAYVQGCTIMVNRPLLDVIVPVPAAAVSHDWWCSLCAAAVGTIDYIPQPTMQYRQHGSNCIGARHGGLFSIAKRVIRDRHYWRNGMMTFAHSLRQSCALSQRLFERGCDGSPRSASVEDYCRVMRGDGTRFGRIWELRKRRIPDVDWLRKLVSYTRVMLLPESLRLQLPAAKHATRAEEESRLMGSAASVPDSFSISMPASATGGIR